MTEEGNEIVAGVIKPLSEAGKAIPQKTQPFTEVPAFVPLKPLSEKGAEKPASFTSRVIQSTSGSDQPK